MWIGTVARGGVELLAFAPDGRHLYTRAAADITAWDLAARTPTKLGLAEYYATNGGLAPSPDGRHLVVTHAERLDVYDLAERRWASQQTLNLRDVWQPTFVNGGDVLLTIEQTHNAEHVFVARRWPSLDLIALDVSPPSETAGARWMDIATDPASGRLAATVQFDGANHLAVFEPGFPDTAVVRTITGETANGWRPVVGPGGGSAAVVRGGGRVSALDLDTGATRFDVRVCRTDVNRLAYHPAGRLLAAVANDGKVYFLDAATGQTLRAFDWQIGKLRSVAFSPDGCVCAAGGVKALAVWDVDE